MSSAGSKFILAFVLAFSVVCTLRLIRTIYGSKMRNSQRCDLLAHRPYPLPILHLLRIAPNMVEIRFCADHYMSDQYDDNSTTKPLGPGYLISCHASKPDQSDRLINLQT